MTNPITAEQARELLEGTTPGPWRISPTDDTMVQASDRSEVADITGDYNDPDLWHIMEANARLIAAAPDLARTVIAQADELARLRADLAKAVAIRSKAIREFCDRAGILPSVEVSGLPDDVKLWRMETAVASRRATLSEITHD